MTDNLYEVLVPTTYLIKADDAQDAALVAALAIAASSHTDRVHCVSFESSAIHAVKVDNPGTILEGLEPGDQPAAMNHEWRVWTGLLTLLASALLVRPHPFWAIAGFLIGWTLIGWWVEGRWPWRSRKR